MVSTFMPLTGLMVSLATDLMHLYGGEEIIHQPLTLGELVAFLSYMRLFFQPLRELSQKYSIVQSALASAERIFHLLDTKSIEIDEQLDQKRKHSLRGDLCFKNVSFSYEKNQPVLQNISFTIREGDRKSVV